MDVYGRRPSRRKGKYFRASIFQWPPILELIRSTGVLSDHMLHEMAFNEGAGPTDQITCDELAIT